MIQKTFDTALTGIPVPPGSLHALSSQALDKLPHNPGESWFPTPPPAVQNSR